MANSDSTATTTISGFAAEESQKLLRRLAYQIARMIRSRGVAEVHDLRVAIRRLLSALTVLKPCIPGKETRKLRRLVKKMRAQAGTVRDLDITLALLEKLRPSRADKLRQRIKDTREAAAKDLGALLKTWKRRNLAAEWRSAQAGVADDSRPVRATAARLLPRLAGEFLEMGSAAAEEKAEAEDLHRFRIAEKNLRYALDLFAPLYGSSLDELLERLRRVQFLLGDINDCVAARRIVSRKAGSREVIAALKRRQRRKTQQFCREWSAGCCAPNMMQRWIAAMRHAGEPEQPGRKPMASAVGRSATPQRSATA